MTKDNHLKDIKTMSRTQLRAKYGTDYNSWKNMKSRGKTDNAIVHAEFNDFADFLRHLGPKPTSSHTLDRIDPYDPEYAPGKCRWSDKKTQASNQRRSLRLTYNGEEKSLTEWAEIHGLKSDTVRRRFHKNQDPEYVLFGEHGSGRQQEFRHSSIPERWPWLGEKNARIWEQKFLDNHSHQQTRFDYFESEFRKLYAELCDDMDHMDQIMSAYDARDAGLLDDLEQFGFIDRSRAEALKAWEKKEDWVLSLNFVREDFEQFRGNEGIFHQPCALRDRPSVKKRKSKS